MRTRTVAFTAAIAALTPLALTTTASASTGTGTPAVASSARILFDNGRGGTTFTIDKASNAGATCLLYRNSVSSTGSTGCFFAVSSFGSGRVALWGDSSPVDDGTGQSGNTPYDGWNDPAGTDAELALNGTDWLAHLS